MPHATVLPFVMAMAITILGARPGAATIDLAIQNNFQTYHLAVQCDSDLELHPDTHLVLPKAAYQFSFDPHVPHQWNCTLSTPGNPSDGDEPCHSGRFIMWQNHMPIPPMREPMCEDHGKCPWLVDEHGLSLIRHPGGEPLHVYDWRVQLGHHC